VSFVRIREHDGRIEVVDSPGLHWLLALLFVSVGALLSSAQSFSSTTPTECDGGCARSSQWSAGSVSSSGYGF
jgi:hypothetical protein